MPNSCETTSAIERVLENLKQTGRSISEVQLRPGDRVVVLDMFGSPKNLLYGPESRIALCRHNLGKRYHYSWAVVVKKSELIPRDWLSKNPQLTSD
jgi:hypothetical protein